MSVREPTPADFYAEGHWLADAGCAACGSHAGLQVHHTVRRQVLRRARVSQYPPDLALVVCEPCHADHTSHARKLPMSALRDENIAHAFDALGAAAYDELHRTYAGTDPRVVAALEREVRRTLTA